jgi:hypothetical protein
MRTILITSLLLALGPSFFRAQDAANAGSRPDEPGGGPPGQTVKAHGDPRTIILGTSAGPVHVT